MKCFITQFSSEAGLTDKGFGIVFTASRLAQIERLKALVAARMDVTVAMMDVDVRFGSYAAARMVVMWLGREVLGLERYEAAALFNKDRTHGTHAIRIISDRMSVDKKFRKLVKELKEEVESWT